MGTKQCHEQERKIGLATKLTVVKRTEVNRKFCKRKLLKKSTKKFLIRKLK